LCVVVFSHLLFVCVVTPASANKFIKHHNMSSWRDLVTKAEALKEREDIQGTFQLLKTAVDDNNQRHPELLWRLGRAHYDVAQESTDKAFVEAQCRKGLERVSESLTAEEASAGAHKWKGILLGCVSDFIPTKEKIASTYVMKQHFERSLQLNERDSTSHHCLAKWCWAMNQISWIERQAANVLFGKPPTCSLEQCKDSLLRSDAIDQTVHNQMMLGDVALKMGHRDESAKWYASAAALPAVSLNQQRQQKEAAKKLASL
jgi:regulator of microtubule dynamics protein 3